MKNGTSKNHLETGHDQAISKLVLGTSIVNILVSYVYIYNIHIYVYILHTFYTVYIYICILEKAQINAHLRDFCFLSPFSPHERNCTTFGILRFVHFEAKIMSVFSREISVNTRPSRNKCAFSRSSEHKKSERA